MKAKSFLRGGLTATVGLLILLLLALPNVMPSMAASSYDYTWTDDFNTSTLHPLWSWVREDATHWSLTARPGFLRITTQDDSLWESFNTQHNLLMTTAPSTHFRITIKVTITPTQNFQKAAILVYQDDDNYLELQRVYADGNKVEFIHEDSGTATFVEVGESATTVYLRIEKEDSTYTGYYSSDGSNWAQIGQYTTTLVCSKVGIGATHELPGVSEIPADFDFFQLEADFPTFGCTRTDDFSSTSLDSRWSWIDEDPAQWSLTAHPGFLRIATNPGSVGDKNLLIQSAPTGDFEIDTHLIFTPTHNYQIAGLVLYQDNDNYLMFGRAYCDWCGGNGIYFDHLEGGSFVGSNFATFPTSQGEAYLRVIRTGNTYTGYYSEDDANWMLIGRHTLGEGISLSRFGLTTAQDIEDIKVPADFDFFELAENCRVFLPMVVKNYP